MQRICGSRSSNSIAVIVVRRSGKGCNFNCSHHSSRLHHHQLKYQQIRGKKTSSSSSSKNDKLQSISRTLKAQNEKMSQHYNNPTVSSNGHIFGLKPVDVTILPPLHRPPPPPPPKSGFQRLVFPFTIVASIGIVAYFYFNNQNDAHEYWDAMQTGGVIPGTYDDDDYDDDDDFDDEEEE